MVFGRRLTRALSLGLGLAVLLLLITFGQRSLASITEFQFEGGRGQSEATEVLVAVTAVDVPEVSSTELSGAKDRDRFLRNPQLLAYTPRYRVAPAHATNFGDRYTVDIYGNPVYNEPIIVLHETVGSAQSALNFFQTPHPNEDDQASYHTLIALDGTVIYIVPPEKRAFGAGNSSFNGEQVRTHAKYPGSVNNFAYHVSFETPREGRNNRRSHSGYTEAQYKSLGWLLAQSTVPENRVTTHRSVDRSGSRIDPRSFDTNRFIRYWRTFRSAQQTQQSITANTDAENPFPNVPA